MCVINISFSVENSVHFFHHGIFDSNVPWAHIKRTYDLYVLGICTKGPVYMNIDSVDYTVQAGDVFLFPANRMHYGSRLSPGAVTYYWLHFSAPALEECILPDDYDLRTLPKENALLRIHFSLLDPNAVQIILHQINDCDDMAEHTLMLKATLFKALLYELSRQVHLQYALKFDRRFFEVFNYVRLHSSESVSLDELADHFGYNKAYLCRLFKKRTGKTIVEFQTNQRISLACQLLCETHLLIKEIAIRTGFQSEKYFMHTFKQHMGMTPTYYRNAYCLSFFH